MGVDKSLGLSWTSEELGFGWELVLKRAGAGKIGELGRVSGWS